MARGQPGLILADEPPQLLVAADLAGAGIVDHHLARPHGLQSVGVTFVQCGEVLGDWISLTGGASLPAHQLHGTGEFRKPRHRNPFVSLSAGQLACRLPSIVLRPPTHPQPRPNESAKPADKPPASLTSYVLVRAQEDNPALIDGASGRALTYAVLRDGAAQSSA